MKHFEIDYLVGSHTFTFKCSTMYEALDAIADIAIYDEKFTFNADNFMTILVMIKTDKLSSYEDNKISLRYVDGEV